MARAENTQFSIADLSFFRRYGGVKPHPEFSCVFFWKIEEIMRMLRTSLCVLALAGIATPVASLYADTIDLTVIDTGTGAHATYSNTGTNSVTASSGGYVTTGNFTYNVSDTGTLGGQAGTTSSTPLSYGVLSVQNNGSISDTVEFILLILIGIIGLHLTGPS